MKALPRSLFVLASLSLAAAAQDTLHLTLAGAMETARKSASSAQWARSRALESEARRDEARSALLPHVGATATDLLRSYNTSTFGIEFPGPTHVDAFNTQDARVGGRITLWDASAWKRYRAARLGAEQAGWDRKAGEDDAALAGAEAYLALLRARALVEARRSEVGLAARLDTLTLDQKKSGSVTQIEVLRARGQLSAAQMALAGATGTEAAARYTLLEILDQPLDAAIETGDSLNLASAIPATGAGSAEAASAGRAEISAAAAGVETGRAELAAARSGLLPTLDLSGDYGLSGRRLNGNAQWTENVMLQLNWNLWDGGGREARVRQRREGLRQAELRLRDARSGAARDVRREQVLLTAAREEAERAAERVALSEEEARLAAEKFRAGSSGNLEVITAQGSVSTAHAAYVDALYGYNRTRLAYLKSLSLLQTQGAEARGSETGTP